MASVTYGKGDLWQVWLMASVTYGKSIMASVIMAKVLWQMKLSPFVNIWWIFKPTLTSLTIKLKKQSVSGQFLSSSY